jgi:hypothetical protein
MQLLRGLESARGFLKQCVSVHVIFDAEACGSLRQIKMNLRFGLPGTWHAHRCDSPRRNRRIAQAQAGNLIVGVGGRPIEDEVEFELLLMDC